MTQREAAIQRRETIIRLLSGGEMSRAELIRKLDALRYRIEYHAFKGVMNKMEKLGIVEGRTIGVGKLAARIYRLKKIP